MGTVQEVTDATFADVVLGSTTPVLVDYWADWCAPCKQLSPIIAELAGQYGAKVTFVKVDTNANAQTASQQGVLSLPTIQIFVNGTVVKAFQGGKTKAALVRALEEFL